MKRKTVGLPYEENVDRRLKNVSARGNLPEESLPPSTERVKSCDQLKDSPCLGHPSPELLITDALQGAIGM